MTIIHGTVRYSRTIKKTGEVLYYCADHAPASATTRLEGSTYGLRCCRCLAAQEKLLCQHRGHTCVGCRNNRYNFASGGDAHNAPTIGDGCWFLDNIRNGCCPQKG